MRQPPTTTLHRPLPHGASASWAALWRQSYLFALLLLSVVAAIDYALQPNFFRPTVLGGNLQTYLPLMLLAAGQAVVIIGGGVDLSVGAMVSLTNVVMVQVLGGSEKLVAVLPAALLALVVGAIAGAFNGICVAYLRFQPIVTTFATSFIFGGLALWVQPNPGGSIPAEAITMYQSNPLRLPLAVWVAGVVVVLWSGLRATRYGPYLYSTGGQPLSAYITGVPVTLVRMSTYIISGIMTACGAVALVLSTGTGSPLIGGPLTLSSVVAVVLGGTRLSGGQGGVVGALLGVVILGFIRSVISFANIPSWYQVLVDGLIVVLALAGPGFIALVWKRQV